MRGNTPTVALLNEKPLAEEEEAEDKDEEEAIDDGTGRSVLVLVLVLVLAWVVDRKRDAGGDSIISSSSNKECERRCCHADANKLAVTPAAAAAAGEVEVESGGAFEEDILRS